MENALTQGISMKVSIYKNVFRFGWLFSLCFSANVIAQQATNQTPPAQENIPEEITINSAPPLTSIQREIHQAQDVMFGLFNELNDDDKFDIYCYYNKRSGSRIRGRVCMANYFRIAQREEAELQLQTYGYASLAPSGPGTNAVTRNNGILQEKMEAIFVEHPEFMQAVNKVNTLTQKYEEQLKKNFGKL